MLDPQEQVVFDDLVARMRSEDPGFSRRVDQMSRPRDRVRTTTAVLLWTAAPICVAVGGWTGMIVAVVAGGYGAKLFSRHNSTPQPQWWTATRGLRPTP